MVPAGRNRARAMTRKPITTHTSAFIARVIGHLFPWGMSIHERSMNVFAHHAHQPRTRHACSALWAGPAVHRMLHDRGGKACHDGFAGSLLPKVATLFHRQAARLKECSHMLARRWRTFDAKPQWLANGIEHGSYVAYGGPPSCFDEFCIEVVERDDTATGGAGDLPQRAFDSLPVQVHGYTLPKEECRFVRIEASMHQLLEPVLRHEISRHERDPSRVQASLFQHQAFRLLRLRGIDLEAVDCFRHPVGSCVPACAENHQLINRAMMAGQSSIEEGRPGSRLLRH